MALRAVVTDVSALPDAVRVEYTKRDDGTYVLQVDGSLPGQVSESEVADLRNKVIGFRDTNTTIMQALGADSVATALERAKVVKEIGPEKLAKLKGIDPDDYRTTKEKLAALETAGAGDPKSVQELMRTTLAKFSDDVVAPLKTDLANEREARRQAQERLDQEQFRRAVGDVALKAKAKPSAIDFLLSRAQEAFEVKEGQIKAKTGQFSQRNPGDPLTIEEWVAKATREYDFAFGSSNGGGAEPNKGGTSVSGQTLVVPDGEQADPAELGRHAAAIASGKMKIVTASGKR